MAVTMTTREIKDASYIIEINNDTIRSSVTMSEKNKKRVNIRKKSNISTSRKAEEEVLGINCIR
jgi:hypothetical protein